MRNLTDDRLDFEAWLDLAGELAIALGVRPSPNPLDPCQPATFATAAGGTLTFNLPRATIALAGHESSLVLTVYDAGVDAVLTGNVSAAVLTAFAAVDRLAREGAIHAEPAFLAAPDVPLAA